MTQPVGFGTGKCYKATVNESETITDAKPANLPAPMTFRSSWKFGAEMERELRRAGTGVEPSRG